VTLEFLKEILAGRKKALKIDKVIALKIPMLPEFTVMRALEEFANDEETMQYLPDLESQSRPLDRTFLFNVLSSRRPNFMASVVDEARNQRIKISNPRKNYVEVELCQEFEKLLLSKPF